MEIFDALNLQKLEQLSLVASRVRVGIMKGDRRSSKRGTSIEFADYRNYTVGDDLRRLDWNIFARLERPFIKLLEEEEDLSVHLLLDTSASMNWPEGVDEENKLRYSARLAAALGHIALSTNDLLTVTLLNSADSRQFGPHRGRHHAFRLVQFLSLAKAQGETNLNDSLRNYSVHNVRPGLLFLISDLLSPGGQKTGLNALLAKGYEIAIIHLLSADELDPPLAGDLKLVDVETADDAEITLDQATVGYYRQRLNAWMEELEAFCVGRGIHYVPVTTETSWESLVLRTMRTRGIVR